MNGLDSVELLKNSLESNAEAWLKQTEIISWGVVTKVITEGIVQVEQIVRNGIARKIVKVPLINLGSALREESSSPTKGDLVLLLFLDKYNRNMFDTPQSRSDDPEKWSIQDKDAVGYNRFSGVGILMSPCKGLAETIIKHHTDGADPATFIRSRAKLTAILRREVSLMFDALPGADGLVDRIVQFTFGSKSPHVVNHWAAVTKNHGFKVKPDLTLGTVEAPVVERYSTMAPITKDIQGSQTISIGLGTDPAGDPAGSPVDTPAPVAINIGANADVLINTKSKITIVSGNVTFEIAVDGSWSVTSTDVSDGPLFAFDTTGNMIVNGNVLIKGDITTKGEVLADGNITANASTAGASVTLLNHMHPTAPMGPPSPPTPGT